MLPENTACVWTEQFALLTDPFLKAQDDDDHTFQWGVPVEICLKTHRVLEQGGKLYISVPDMDTLCHFFVRPVLSYEIKFHVMRMIFGGQVDKYDFHYFGWNQEIMLHFLKLAGFKTFKRVESFNLFNDTSDYKPLGFPVSLNVIVTK